MKINLCMVFILSVVVFNSCHSFNKDNQGAADKTFARFEHEFLNAYWKQYPAQSIFAGYNKYYDLLEIPDSSGFADNISFSKQWIELLNLIDSSELGENNKISSKIIRNRLESDIWYTSVFKLQEWDASQYNISGECDYIINQPYAILDERLRILSKHLQLSDNYYKAAFNSLHRPVKEYVELSILQNQGGLSVFGAALNDSINRSHLTTSEKDSLQQNVIKTVNAINSYVKSLKAIIANKDYPFRDFRIGKELYNDKFKYDLATDLTPEEVYAKASADKKRYHEKMFMVADSLWNKYYATQNKPTDSIQLVQLIMDKIQLQHAKPKDFFDSLSGQLHRLKKFIIEKKLFDFDTINPPVEVRIMPAYERGFTVANAEFSPPYQQKGIAYYNIDDLTSYTPEKAESVLREYNNYGSQLLTIHEGVPGHCLQGNYNNKKSADVLRSVFMNGAMVEGWAVYTEAMMLENGWGDHSPEMQLAFYKWKLRELANVIVDYDMQCLNKPKDSILRLLVNDCFQTTAQAEEKYHRATVSQVQLCSYYTGATAIELLREDYKNKMGDKYSLKDFHEKFLSFGSSPVKYIRERMLQ